jgi:hypothetical protein
VLSHSGQALVFAAVQHLLAVTKDLILRTGVFGLVSHAVRVVKAEDTSGDMTDRRETALPAMQQID